MQIWCNNFDNFQTTKIVVHITSKIHDCEEKCLSSSNWINMDSILLLHQVWHLQITVYFRPEHQLPIHVLRLVHISQFKCKQDKNCYLNSLTIPPPTTYRSKVKGFLRPRNYTTCCFMVIHPYAKIWYAYVKEQRHLARLKSVVKI